MIDTQSISDAILATGCAPVALEEGSDLVTAWVETPPAIGDVLAVEAGWSIRLDERTWVVGVQDAVSSEIVASLPESVRLALGRSSGLVVSGNEWKTTKAPSKYWTEEKWLESIKSGPQIALYALALARGEFYQWHGDAEPPEIIPTKYAAVPPVPIRVRAAVKTAVPMFWPKDPADGWQVFNAAALEAVAQAFLVEAACIRAARKHGGVPWQLPGKHCEPFKDKVCSHFLSECSIHQSKVYAGDTASIIGFSKSDPAYAKAVRFLPAEASSPDTVILSASSYQNSIRCLELTRLGESEESLALQTGTVFHAGLAAYYEQVRTERM